MKSVTDGWVTFDKRFIAGRSYWKSWTDAECIDQYRYELRRAPAGNYAHDLRIELLDRSIKADDLTPSLERAR